MLLCGTMTFPSASLKGFLKKISCGLTSFLIFPCENKLEVLHQHLPVFIWDLFPNSIQQLGIFKCIVTTKVAILVRNYGVREHTPWQML